MMPAREHWTAGPALVELLHLCLLLRSKNLVKRGFCFSLIRNHLSGQIAYCV